MYFLADQHNVGRLHHRVGCLDRSNKTFGLDHSQGVEWHASGTLTDRKRCPPSTGGGTGESAGLHSPLSDGGRPVSP